MKSCWEILEIKVTTDIEAIENARNTLIDNEHLAPLTDKGIQDSRSREISEAFDRAMAFANAWKPVARKPAPQSTSKKEPLSKGNHAALFVLGKPVGAGGSWWSR